MLEIKFVREKLEEVKKVLGKRSGKADFLGFSEHEKKRRKLLQEIEELRHHRNIVSDEIAEIRKSGNNADSTIAEMRKVSEEIKKLGRVLSETETFIHDFMISLPNIPHHEVPKGVDEKDNRLEKKVGTPGQFDFEINPTGILGKT